MFKLATLIGIYSYVIFFAGVLGNLNNLTLFLVTFFFVAITIFTFFKNVKNISIRNWITSKSLFEQLLLLLLFVLASVNFIGALGPELGFDALWYHLTIPKIWLINESIYYIPGGLFHYTVMPKLIDILYIPILAFSNEILAKILQFLFGIASLVVIYRLAKLFLSTKYSIISCLIFYSNLVVSWLSISANIDLGRTFFELLALYYVALYSKEKSSKFLIYSSIVLGLAIATKITALASILIFIPLIFYVTKSVYKTAFYVVPSLLIPLPWFIFSFISTGNPFFPINSEYYNPEFSISLKNFMNFVHSSDPISPIYLITLPLAIFIHKKFKGLAKVIAIYSLLAFLVWFITPQTGGGRFIVVYLGAFSITSAFVISSLKQKFVNKLVIAAVLLIALTTLLYRAAANYKYIDVIIGKQSKDEFLTNNLNFSFGDFYDTDNYFKNNIKKNDKVLLLGLHNLYYINFPFVHESYFKENEFYNYILLQNGQLPIKYNNFKLVYENAKTHVKLYKKE